MFLSRHQTPNGPCWALDGELLVPAFDLGMLLELPRATYPDFLPLLRTGEQATGRTLAPVELMHEVWASGVTYLRSRDARQAESETGDEAKCCEFDDGSGPCCQQRADGEHPDGDQDDVATSESRNEPTDRDVADRDAEARQCKGRSEV